MRGGEGRRWVLNELEPKMGGAKDEWNEMVVVLVPSSKTESRHSYIPITLLVMSGRREEGNGREGGGQREEREGRIPLMAITFATVLSHPPRRRQGRSTTNAPWRFYLWLVVIHTLYE